MLLSDLVYDLLFSGITTLFYSSCVLFLPFIINELVSFLLEFHELAVIADSWRILFGTVMSMCFPVVGKPSCRLFYSHYLVVRLMPLFPLLYTRRSFLFLLKKHVPSKLILWLIVRTCQRPKYVFSSLLVTVYLYSFRPTLIWRLILPQYIFCTPCSRFDRRHDLLTELFFAFINSIFLSVVNTVII